MTTPLHRPTLDESALSWLRMSLVCWKVVVKPDLRHRSTRGGGKVSNHVGHRTCGHGYSPGDAVTYHPPGRHGNMYNQLLATNLGASPTENRYSNRNRKR